MTSLPSDFFHSWRVFRRSPGLALAAIAALAMGIGFTTTMFSIVHGGTRALPFDAPERFVVVQQTHLQSGATALRGRPFEARRWRDLLTSFDGLEGFTTAAVNLSSEGQPPERVSAAIVTPGSLSLTGVRPQSGRLFDARDAAPGAQPVAIVDAELAALRFGSEAAAVGTDLRLDGVPHRVIGVMPRGFGFPIDARLWTPLSGDLGSQPGTGPSIQIFGRLRDGVSPTAASEEVALDVSRLAVEAPTVFEGRSARVVPFIEIETPAEVRRGLQVLVATVSLVLLVACANVANLLLARAAARSRDTAIRTALGASRGRLVVQQLVESSLLAGCAAILGLGMTWLGLRFFAVASSSILTAFWVDFRIDIQIVAFASFLGLVAALAAGLIPALRASQAGVGPLLQSGADRAGGPRIGRLGRSLVVVQLALACGLLVVTTTLVGAAGAMRLVPNPFPQDRVLTAQLSVLPALTADGDDRQDLLLRLRDRLEATPAFERAALTSVFPGRGAGRWSFTVADTADGGTAGLATGVAMITPGFFEMAGATALRGRLLTWQDDARAPLVAVVNESFASRYLSDRENPIGRRVRVGISEADFTVVGVVPDLLMQDVEDAAGDGMYLPMLQHQPFTIRVMAQTRGEPLTAASALRDAIADVDPDLPVYEISTLRAAIFEEKRVLDAFAALFFTFGLGTVFMAVLGLHALLSFAVTQRRREFGVRMALGASGRDLVRLVMRRGGTELLWGLGLGLALAAALSRLLASAIEPVTAAGPQVLGLIAAIVTLGALAAVWRPIRQVLRLDPLAALRRE